MELLDLSPCLLLIARTTCPERELAGLGERMWVVFELICLSLGTRGLLGSLDAIFNFAFVLGFTCFTLHDGKKSKI